MNNIKIGVVGGAGRMGQALCKTIDNYNGVQLAGVFSNSINFSHKKLKDLDNLYGSSDIIIDFSNHLLFNKHLRLALDNNKPLILGTTALSCDQIKKLESASKKIPIFYDTNFSFGINLIHKILKTIKNNLKYYDIAISEIHHKNKQDLPSGTALSLKKTLSKKNSKINEDTSIPISSLRLADFYGIHKIIIANDDEEITIKHRAKSTKLFAEGAIIAAIWLNKQSKSGLFSMSDIIG